MHSLVPGTLVQNRVTIHNVHKKALFEINWTCLVIATVRSLFTSGTFIIVREKQDKDVTKRGITLFFVYKIDRNVLFQDMTGDTLAPMGNLKFT